MCEILMYLLVLLQWLLFDLPNTENKVINDFWLSIFVLKKMRILLATCYFYYEGTRWQLTGTVWFLDPKYSYLLTQVGRFTIYFEEFWLSKHIAFSLLIILVKNDIEIITFNKQLNNTPFVDLTRVLNWHFCPIFDT